MKAKQLSLLFSLLILLFLPYSGFGQQNTKSDSLLTLLETAAQDTTRVRLLSEIAETKIRSTPDEAATYAKQALILAQEHEFLQGISKATDILVRLDYILGNFNEALANLKIGLEARKKLNDKVAIADSYNKMGVIHKYKSEYALAIGFYFKSLEIRQEIGDSVGEAACHNNLGLILKDQGKYDESIDHLYKSLKIREKLEDETGISDNYVNISSVHSRQGNFKEALDYALKGLEIKRKIDNPYHLAHSLNITGAAWFNLGKMDKALQDYTESLNLRMGMGDQKGMASSYNNLSGVYQELDDYDAAIKSAQKSYDIKVEIGDDFGAATSLINIGFLNSDIEEYKIAEEHFLTALSLAKKVGAPKLEGDAAEGLSQVYSLTGKFQKAYEMHVMFKEMTDSLFNQNITREIATIEAQHAFEVEQREKDLAAQTAALLEAERIQKRNAFQYLLIFGLMVLLLGSFVYFSRKSGNFKFWYFSRFLAVLLFFEFLVVLLDPFLDQLTGGVPAPKLLVNLCLAAIFTPLLGTIKRKLKKRKL